MTFIKILLTLLVLATAALAIVMARPAPPPPLSQPYPTDAMLEAKIDNLQLEWATPDQAVAALSAKTGVKIQLDWQSLQAAGVSRTQQQSAIFQDTRLIDAMNDLFRLYSDKAGVFDFQTNAAGALVVSAGADTNIHVRLYDVRDLLTDAYWGVPSDPSNAQSNQESRLTSLADLIASRLGAESPRLFLFSQGSGPPKSAVEIVAGTLLVSDTPAHQRDTEILLAWLRRMR